MELGLCRRERVVHPQAALPRLDEPSGGGTRGAVSEHLSELRKAGLIIERKEGRWVEYRLSDAALRDGTLDAIWPALEEDREAKADAVLVKELRRVPLDELCSVDLDLARLQRSKLATAVAKAAQIRAREGVPR